MEDSAGIYGSDAALLIHEMFEERVGRYPEAIAVTFKGRSLTYHELSARSNQLARYLLRQGVGPESRVAICIERSLEMVIGVLGILKAGAAYVPLDPSYPAERLGYMLADCKPAALLTQDHLRSALPPVTVPRISLDSDWSMVEESSKADSGEFYVPVTSRNLAYVIYTSGSTGMPKGVMVEHANVTRFLSAVGAWFQFEPGCVWGLFHSFAFDVSVMELWGSLLSGGRLVVVSYATSRFPGDLYTLLSNEAVAVLCQTPSAFRRLIAAQATSSGPLSLKAVLLAGEALQLGSLVPWFEREPNRWARVVNLYGPTETTVYVTYHAVKPSDKELPGGSVIGVPLANSRISIFDEQRKEVSLGTVGEIYIGGLGVARGYFNRPELTAERFIADPTGIQGLRIYRSGDLGRWREDGTVEYRGRNDSQVKVRGFRIELGEIEHHLSEIVGVREGVVLALQDASGDAKLIAYVTQNEGSELTAQSLRGELLRRLPIYMVPSDYQILLQMPMNGSGKTDRKALSQMASTQTNSGPTALTLAQRAPDEKDPLSAPKRVENSVHPTATTH